MKKYFIAFFAVLFVVGLFVFVFFSNSGIFEKNFVPEPYSANSIPESSSKKPVRFQENTNVSSSMDKIRNYALISDGNRVYLVVRYSDGSETKTVVENIDINFLTDVDKELLQSGVELPDKESVYKLIEDYSS